jgi:hypothetical protein
MNAQGSAQALMVEQEEQRLVDRLLRLQTAAGPAAAAASAAEKQVFYSDAYAFLQAHGGQHWWCRHGDVTAGAAAGGPMQYGRHS